MWPGWRHRGPAVASGRSASHPSTSAPPWRAELWPEVTAILTSATVPPLLEERLGLPKDRNGPGGRGESVSLRAQRRALLRLPSPRSPQSRCHRGDARRDRRPGPRRRRSHPGAVHELARHGRRRGGDRAAGGVPGVDAERATQGAPDRGVRATTSRHACSPRCRSGRASTSRARR